MLALHKPDRILLGIEIVAAFSHPKQNRMSSEKGIDIINQDIVWHVGCMSAISCTHIAQNSRNGERL